MASYGENSADVHGGAAMLALVASFWRRSFSVSEVTSASYALSGSGCIREMLVECATPPWFTAVVQRLVVLHAFPEPSGDLT